MRKWPTTTRFWGGYKSKSVAHTDEKRKHVKHESKTNCYVDMGIKTHIYPKSAHSIFIVCFPECSIFTVVFELWVYGYTFRERSIFTTAHMYIKPSQFTIQKDKTKTQNCTMSAYNLVPLRNPSIFTRQILMSNCGDAQTNWTNCLDITRTCRYLSFVFELCHPLVFTFFTCTFAVLKAHAEHFLNLIQNTPFETTQLDVH